MNYTYILSRSHQRDLLKFIKINSLFFIKIQTKNTKQAFLLNWVGFLKAKLLIFGMLFLKRKKDYVKLYKYCY